MLDFLKRGKRKESEDTEVIDSSEIALVILTDRRIPNMSDAFRDRGIPVFNIYTDIEEIKIGLLMQSGLTRVVIIDTGLGEFTTVTMRDEMTDLIGMCDGKEKRLSVFYTDSIIKSDSIKVAPKNTDWQPYTAMSSCIDAILKYKERYVDGEIEGDSELCSIEDALKIVGKEVEVKNTVDMPLCLDAIDICKHIVDKENIENCLQSYEISY